MLAELAVQLLERLHLPLPLAGARPPGRLQVRDRRLARLERRGGHRRAEIAAGQLHRRGRPADVHERRQVLVAAAQRVRHPAPEGRMIELPAPVPGAGLDHRREVVALVAPHRPDHGDLIDHAADVGEPVGDRDARLPVPRERPQAGDHRPPHLRQVVAEPDRVDQLARPLVVLRVEGVDVADAAAHEQEDHRSRPGREMRPSAMPLESRRPRPRAAQARRRGIRRRPGGGTGAGRCGRKDRGVAASWRIYRT